MVRWKQSPLAHSERPTVWGPHEGRPTFNLHSKPKHGVARHKTRFWEVSRAHRQDFKSGLFIYVLSSMPTDIIFTETPQPYTHRYWCLDLPQPPCFRCMDCASSPWRAHLSIPPWHHGGPWGQWDCNVLRYLSNYHFIVSHRGCTGEGILQDVGQSQSSTESKCSRHYGIHIITNISKLDTSGKIFHTTRRYTALRSPCSPW